MQGIEKFTINEYSNIKNVIAVVSGKGGVGKSFTSSMLAVHLKKMGYKVGILDADITGPSIPEAFGIDDMAVSDGVNILPQITKTGIKLISVNSVLENKSAPVLWRGPLINSAIKQFFSEVFWGNLDYLIVDMPPGTGDVALTVFQSMPLTGVVIVSTPQDLVKMIVEKAINMANMMRVKILGFVENMSYYKCKSCGEISYIFGPGKIKEIAEKEGVKNILNLPIEPEFANFIDKGEAEEINIPEFENFIRSLKKWFMI